VEQFSRLRVGDEVIVTDVEDSHFGHIGTVVAYIRDSNVLLIDFKCCRHLPMFHSQMQPYIKNTFHIQNDDLRWRRI
jgi:hypothetical protein